MSANERRAAIESNWETIVGTDGKTYRLVPLPRHIQERVTEDRDPFLAPLTGPTRYFDGQEDLIRVLKFVGLEARDRNTVVHLVARALTKDRERP